MNVLQFLKENKILYLDGGMGTLLVERGLEVGEQSESWNVSHPEIITEIHKSYFEAGSNVVLANTFGVNAYKYDDETIEKLVECAVANAKRAASSFSDGKARFVALDIGPSGKMLKPFGDLDYDEAITNFKKLVVAGVRAGADLVMIETFNDLAETKAAVLAVKETCDLPVFVSNAYGEDGKLLSGSTPEAVAVMLEGLGVDAVGCNCSFGPEKLLGVIKELLGSTSLPVLFKPNAGLPCEDCGRTYYDVLPEDFALEVSKAAEMGASIFGGCCGTTPEYIKALTSVCTAGNRTINEKRTVVSSFSHAVRIGDAPVIIGERINPTGKKAFKEAITRRDYAYVLEEAVKEVKCGSDILDVNVGVPGTDEKEILFNTVFKLQAVVDTPLCIDTSDPVALERALRIYAGKPLINSVNGKTESMQAVFPLAKKYGGAVVCLTLDERGIPATVEERVEIAKRIVAQAEKYGIGKQELVFDSLTMAVSADKNAPIVCLETLKRLKDELGVKTVLGVSNVSFGLPQRDIINAAFLSLALSKGLDAAILNPFSFEMQKAFKSYCALLGYDTACLDYIDFASSIETQTSGAITPLSSKNTSVTTLKEAIVAGLKDQAAAFALELVEKKDGIYIINEDIMPALNEVGSGFEKKTIYLPQLLMSAESAKAAFDVVKTHLKSEGGAKKSKIVIATVKGDVHDIGKNIVKLLLENYGFYVIDLGKDVGEETVLKAVIDEKADILGLSALMTTTVVSMEKTIALVKENAPYCKIMVGGAVLTKDYAERIGADYYAKDALDSVKYAESIEQTK